MGLQPFQLCDEDLTPAVAKALAGEPHLAVDTETMGLIPQRDRLCVVQIANSAGEVVLLRLSRGVKQAPFLAQLLMAPSIEKIFHYARFDLAMLRYHLGIRAWPVFCTKIASKLARTYTSKHSLKDVVSELCGVELNKAAQSSDWGGRPRAIRRTAGICRQRCSLFDPGAPQVGGDVTAGRTLGVGAAVFPTFAYFGRAGSVGLQ